jgi:hypothetical protein
VLVGKRISMRLLAKEFTFSPGRGSFFLICVLLGVLALAAPALAQTTTTSGSGDTTLTASASSESTATSTEATTTTPSVISAGPTTGVTEPADPTQQCLTCHRQAYLGNVQVKGKAKNLYIDPTGYHDSVHGILPCTACHINFSHNPHQMVNNAEAFAKTASEACRNCHDNEFEMYKQSYHGRLTKGGVVAGTKAPVCIDCHGTHKIQKVDSLAYRQEIQTICGKCHGGHEATFLDTYHGKAITLGRGASATCVDCHGSHSILPKSNPQSAISAQNILPTCQKCHPNASQGFTTFLVHIKATSPKAPMIVFLVAIFYLSMIIAVFIFGGTHTLLYIYRGLKDGLYFKKGGH